ncbi:carboxylesterase 12 [Pyrus ussuriensis x Pyrus communis]|uniref:Carboxylesterase 12 n=1 Tax=Pyrus ussuriensis x Pyrus communis TaxID=2448454 RepID=A0A5N5I8D1_9ROSA|nr:carboxylesterase 12 [Pyrus ussuriensis x Pyrus communis]
MSNEELSYDFSPMIKVYKDGRVERLLGTATVPPSTQPETGVQSKDIVISHQPAISARLYIPKFAATKLPLLVYFHGGGFCIQSASSPTYHDYLNSLVSEANVVAVSVEYRLAPEHPIPAAYDDSWAALKWRVFFAGDSAGANIAHHMGLKVGSEGLLGVKLIGIVLVHPYFWGSDLIGVELNAPANIRDFVAAMWRFDPKLGELGCGKVVVFVAEKDVLKERGWYYGEVLRKSGWNGVVEVMEAEREEHCFHLADLTCENAVAMRKKIVSFLNQV